MGDMEFGPGSALDVITAAIETGAKRGDVLTLTDSEGDARAVTLGDRVVLPSAVPPPLLQ